MKRNLAESLSGIKIVPVAVFQNPSDALRTAERLMEHSLGVLEITLRTDAAFQCLKEIAGRFPGMLLGAGSVLSADSLRRAAEAGAMFGVAPCLDEEVLAAASSMGLPFIPGVATPSELHMALRAGAEVVKIFPAVSLGGTGYIRDIIAPFRMKNFSLVPTGGINEKNILEFLRTEKVVACGATWVVDGRLVEEGRFDEIGKRVRAVMEMIAGMT